MKMFLINSLIWWSSPRDRQWIFNTTWENPGVNNLENEEEEKFFSSKRVFVEEIFCPRKSMAVREKDVEYLIIPMPSDYFLLLTWSILFIVFYIDIRMTMTRKKNDISSSTIDVSQRQTRSLINISLDRWWALLISKKREREKESLGFFRERLNGYYPSTKFLLICDNTDSSRT